MGLYAAGLPLVIEPLSLIFFRVPSCAAAGTAMARARAARIRVIGRVMSFSLRVGGWWGRLQDSTGVPRSLSKRRRRPAALESDLCLQKDRDMSQAPTRLEHDLRGARAVPADAYYGIHTLRALENFRITGTAISIYPELVRALACVKQAAALATNGLGLLPDDRTGAIVRACEEIRGGELLDQFLVDVIQGGEGTSTNMNANEVIANRGLELLGHGRGEYRYLHPVEDVNMSQSTNDVYPTAVKVALHFAIGRLGAAMQELRRAFGAKALEITDVLKIGRTQLQDAVPMTLGQEFTTYAVMLEEDEERLREAALLITEINLGATAIGTGINAHPDYAALVCQRLADITGIRLVTAPNLVEATQDAGAYVQLSGVLKRIAVKLSKVCNDLRLLSSGPRAGLGEINLPPGQAGAATIPRQGNTVLS